MRDESPRRVWALVDGLPPEAECFRRPREEAPEARPARPGKVVSLAEFAARNKEYAAA